MEICNGQQVPHLKVLVDLVVFHATVGVNKGDGINFVQIGRFDQAGSFL